MRLSLLFLLAGCTSSPVDSGVDSGSSVSGPVPWSGDRVWAADELPEVRGHKQRRAIMHLHSPWSHDACDGNGITDGVYNGSCLDDLRRALCTTAIDFAFLTDHPSFAGDQSWDDLLFSDRGDPALSAAGATIGLQIQCDGGRSVRWLPGTEDDLSWMTLKRHIGASPEENNRLYNAANNEALQAGLNAGGVPFIAHTEGRDPTQLAQLQAGGLHVVEIFNLHAMFAPDKRENDLGLDPMGWVGDMAPFTSPDGTAQPDLLMLAVLAEQAPSIERWETMLQRGPVTGIAGTDAHQNIGPFKLRDEERLDSYRRMLRWFVNVLLVTEDSPAGAQDALEQGRMYVAFDILGVPTGFDLHLTTADGTVLEMGESGAVGGTLSLSCPTLSASSPTNAEEPTLHVAVYRNNALIGTECGEYDATAPGTYRAKISLTPTHLRDFLGDAPEVWLKPYPWVLSNAIRVGLDG